MKDKKGLISINTSYFFRGIAILMVIFSHYFEWGADSIGSEKLVHFIASLGDYGVGIFFFMSGYALYKGYRYKNTDKAYLYKRFRNMYLPYLLIAGIIAIWSKSIDSLKAFIRLVIGADYWFIIIILIIYLVFYFVGKLPDKYRVILMTLFIIDMSLWLYLKGYNDFWYTANWAFALGMIVCKYEGKVDFTIEIKDYLLCFIGKITIYIYVLHSFIYFKIINIEALSNLNWYIKLIIAINITILISYLIHKVIGNDKRRQSS